VIAPPRWRDQQGLKTSRVARAITTARKLIAGATSANARRAYDTGWRQFTAHESNR
jgi:hypothetical protein